MLDKIFMLIFMPRQMDTLELDQQFTNRVMRRVRFVFITRKFLKPIYIEIAGALCLPIILSLIVSLDDVVRNSPEMTEMGEFAYFLQNAFLNTEIPVQIVTVAFVVSGALLLKNAVKGGISVYNHRFNKAHSVA